MARAPNRSARQAKSTKNAKATKKSAPNQLAEHLRHRLREGFFILGSALAVFLLFALLTYHQEDPAWSHTSPSEAIANAGGKAGAWFADVFFYLFGYLSFLFPAMVAYTSWLLFKERFAKRSFDYLSVIFRCLGFCLTVTAGAGLAALHFGVWGGNLPLSSGGILGNLIAHFLIVQFNFQGATLFLLAIFLCGVTLATGLSWLRTMDHTGRMLWNTGHYFVEGLSSITASIRQKFTAWRNQPKPVAPPKPIIKPVPIIKPQTPQPPAPQVMPQHAMQQQPTQQPPKPKITAPIKRPNRESQLPLFDQPNMSLPSFGLLEAPTKDEAPVVSPEELEHVSRLVEARLKDFGVEVHVVAVEPGPVITRFELQLAAGIKVSKISGLAKDLARSLSVVSVRVVEIIPGKPVVGLEIPNASRQTVRLQEVLTVEEYEKATSPLSLALGKDIAGVPVVVDLAKMPHLLVAGTTGSGKSVGVNAMILSILYRAQPEEVRMIMIDPKMLELSVYEGIPHLLAPVVTDMKEAANALRWCVAEMERRYKLLATMGVRNMQGYNRKVKDAAKAGKPLLDPFFKAKHPDDEPPLLELMPYIVVIVDEFADMIMVVGKKVEELIARIAQKARAAGIHLILATQRPSVDVITGLIKANIPTRIAFQVASRIDSRTILDQQGAEQLLGRGDMLYLPAGAGIPMRVHGAFVADQEVHSVVKDWKQRGEPDYDDSVLNGGGSSGAPGGYEGSEDGEEYDELFDQAVAIVTETRKASISGVQRRLKIGYNRAARMLEQMEATGVVSSVQSNGMREVLAPPPPAD